MSVVDLLSNTGYIMYNKQVAKLLGVYEAILIGELCAKHQYWESHGDLENNEGWFYLTREDIENDTGLSAKQQRPALEVLYQKGLVECKRMGIPAKLFYRLKIENLTGLMCPKGTTGDSQTSQQAAPKGQVINKENKKETKKETNKAIDDFFEQLWQLFPNKKGKGSVSATKKAQLYKIGWEEMRRCIQRYLAGMEKEPWRKTQYGSTFFNSGYVDYLDKNYIEPKPFNDNQWELLP